MGLPSIHMMDQGMRNFRKNTFVVLSSEAKLFRDFISFLLGIPLQSLGRRIPPPVIAMLLCKAPLSSQIRHFL